MPSSRLSLISLLAACISPVLSQTFTACNPLDRTDCPSDPALGIDYSWNFTTAPTDNAWNITNGQMIWGDQGAQFVINKKGDSPTIQSNFYIFFGRVEVHMRAAPGTGIVSSVVLESDDLDEVDWECIGGNHTFAETNYFGKGNTTVYDRAIWYPVDDVVDTYHNYTTVWTAEKLEWYIDGTLTRSLAQADADDNGYDYPQTPMYLRIGNWVGGDPTEDDNGTITWAGGLTDYSQAPFNMYVNLVHVTDFSNGSKEYIYGDTSGSWQSIKVIEGNSTIAEALLAPPPTPAPSISQKWASTSSTTKIVVYAIAGAVAAVIASVSAFYCIRKRRAGQAIRLAQDEKFEKQRQEMQHQQAMFQRNAGVDLGGYANVPPASPGLSSPGLHSPSSPGLGGFRSASGGYGSQYDARSLDDRPREGHGFIS
jgi:hypothetical protein